MMNSPSLFAFNFNLRHYIKATSKDEGRSWSTAEAITSLPNPNAKIAALGGLGAGRKWVVMVLNDHKELPQPFRRCRLGPINHTTQLCWGGQMGMARGAVWSRSLS